MKRYATIWISTLNGRGTGKVVLNLKTRADFEHYWRNWFGTRFEVPKSCPWLGECGGIGDGVIGFSYKIYAQDSNPYEHRSLESRLFSYKLTKHIERLQCQEGL